MKLLHARRIRILRTAHGREADIILRRIIVARHNRTVGHRRACIDLCQSQPRLGVVQRDVRGRIGLQHRIVDHRGGAVVGFIVRRLLLDREVERCLGNGHAARQIAEGTGVKLIVPCIRTAEADRTRELDGLVRADSPVQVARSRQGSSREVRVEHHLRLETARGKVKVDRAISNILRCKPRGADAAACECLTERLCHIALAVIHARRAE